MQRKELHADPLLQFTAWYEVVKQKSLQQYNAMALATVGKTGQPSVRMVLLKEYGEAGFVFFTNYNSKKGQELADNSQAAVVFYWPACDWQIRIEGVVKKISRDLTRQYFFTRPLKSQISAWASPQSQVIDSREALVQKVDMHELKLQQEGSIDCPPNWGGYLIEPVYYEFWENQEHRLHDRFCYEKSHENKWLIQRLAP